MNSITRLAFAVAIAWATTSWMAGRPAVTDQSDPLNPGAAPLRFTQATRAADGPGDGACESDAEDDPDDSSPRPLVPLLSPVSADATNGRPHYRKSIQIDRYVD